MFISLILDPPEIEIEKNVVHTGAGYEAQLTCVVHGEPTPHVVWYKETTQLGTTEQHSQQVVILFYLSCFIFWGVRAMVQPLKCGQNLFHFYPSENIFWRLSFTMSDGSFYFY